MLADRSTLRRDDFPPPVSAWFWLVAALAATFVVELVLRSPGIESGAGLLDRFSLTVRNLQAGRIWTLLTYSLRHDPANVLHLLAVLLGLVLVGRELEPAVGARKFLAIFFGAVLAGGLAWTAVHWSQGGAHLGAGAGVFGLLVVLACLHPKQELTFLAFFIFPVTLRPRHLFHGLLLLDAVALVVLEIPRGSVPLGISPSALLGGMLAGWISYRFFLSDAAMDRGPFFQWPGWIGWPARRSEATQPAAAARPGPSPADFRAEVDRILDKINSEGFGALTEDEKRVLDEAKDLLSRH